MLGFTMVPWLESVEKNNEGIACIHKVESSRLRLVFFRVELKGEIASTVTGAECSEKLKRLSILKSISPRIDSERQTIASVVQSET
jgi:hypothetical protein